MGARIFIILSSRFWPLSRSYISYHAQGIFLSTSHIPLLVPPQGPLNMLFAHLVTGQIPPVYPSWQSLQKRHFSSNQPTSLLTPIKVVFSAGNTGIFGKRSAIN